MRTGTETSPEAPVPTGRNAPAATERAVLPTVPGDRQPHARQEAPGASFFALAQRFTKLVREEVLKG